jgi:ubiquitin-protein ligase
MNPRLRRLQSDYEKVQSRFLDWPSIVVTHTRGTPPDFYQIQYAIKSLAKQMDGRLVEVDSHLMEISLNIQYPRRAPSCKLTTPIFHPNIDASSVCIGDFWASSEALDSLIIRIGRMIAYQEYNVKSPLDGIAAKWASENANLLPIDGSAIEPPMLGTVETGQFISIVDEVSPDSSYGGEVEPQYSAHGVATTHEEDHASVNNTDGKEVSLENLISVGDSVSSMTITLPLSLEFINLKAKCVECSCEMRIEPDLIVCEGFNCPQCNTYHKFK